MKVIQNRTTRYRLLESLVPHSQYKKSLIKLEDLFEARLEDGHVQGMCITAHSGYGKTTIAQEFLNNHPSYDTPDRTITPVLSFSMPTSCTGKGLYQTALNALGCSELSGTETALARRLFQFLKGCQVKVVLVDEAQHLLHLPNLKKQAQAADCVKSIMTQAKVSIVLMGTSALKNLMMANGELRSRFATKIKLTDWEPNVIDDMNEVAGIITKLLKDSQTSLSYEELFDSAFVSRMIFASGGRIGNIQKLLIHATFLAESANDKKLQSKHFQETFKSVIWDEAESETNPFHKDFNFKLLDGPNQPYWVEV